MKARIVLLVLSLCISLGLKAQMSDAQQMYTDTIENILDLDEVEIEVESAGLDMGCPVRIKSIPVSKLDRSSAPSRLLAASSIPGVEMITSGGGVIRPAIRGLSGLRVSTLYRGAKIESQAWAEDHGIYIPEQGVNRIEVIKGPSALAYGTDGIGGVINFVAEDPLQEIGRESRLSYRWFTNTDGIQASVITRKKSEKTFHSFSGGYNYHKDYRKPNGEVVDNSDYQQFFGQGEFGYILDWGLIDGAYSSAYNNAGIIGLEDGWQQSGDHLITANATLMRLGLKIKPIITYQLNHRIEFHNDEGVDEIELDMSLRTLRYELKAVKTLNNDIHLITGVQGASTKASNGEELEHTFLPDANQTDLGAYLITSLERGGLGIKAAARGDVRNVEWQDKAKTFALGAGSMGVNWGIAHNVDVLAIASLSKRAPSIAELGANGLHHGAYRYELGNEDLVAETSKNLELNLSKKSVNTALDVTVFRNQIDDFIHYRAEEGVFIDGYQKYKYVSTNALLQGWEMGLTHYDEPIGLTAMAAVSYVEGLDLVADTTLPFIPPLTLNISLTYEQKEVLGLNDFFTTLSYTHTSSFEVFSLSLGFAVGSTGNIQFSANNLMNEEFIPVMSLLRELNFPQAGRDFSVSFSVNF